MKVIRQKKSVVSMDINCEDENNNDLENLQKYNITFTDDIENESGFFHLAIRPLLAPGHESELVYFMQSMGLIQQFMYCKLCGKIMKWVPSRTRDWFQWKCVLCNKKCSIREKSPFSNSKCGFKNILLVLLAWCNNVDIEITAEMLDIKKAVVTGLYQLAGNTVERFIRSNIGDWKIGGPGVIVLVDTFPEGCTSDVRQCNRPILCIAELKDRPPTMWFEALEANSRNQEEISKLNQQKCLEVVQTIIHPESIVVARQSCTLCSYEDLKKIEHKFKIVVSNEGLTRHDSREQRLLDNLAVIWREALDVCMTTQHCHYSMVPSFLVSYMWRRRFKLEAYQCLLNEISALVI